MMFLNILVYLWFILYLIAISLAIPQIYRNARINMREFSFFILGIAIGGIPFYWIMQHL